MRRRYIFWGLVIVWMMVIFNFSSDNKEASSYKSKQVAAVVQQMASKIPEDIKSVYSIENVTEYIVRKTGHVLEYFLLTSLIIAATLISNKGMKTACKNGLMISLLFAISDELHQLYTPGRGAQLSDVLIDGIGILTALALAMMLSFARKVLRLYQ